MTRSPAGSCALIPPAAPCPPMKMPSTAHRKMLLLTWPPPTSSRPSSALHPTVVATGTSIVDVQIAHVFILERASYARFELASIHDLRSEHHGGCVISPDGQESMPEHDRNLICFRAGGRCTLTDEDWSQCSVWRRHIVMSKRHEQDGLTNFSVGETHPAWVSRLLIDSHSTNTLGLQLRLALFEQIRELLGAQGDQSKRSVHATTSTGFWNTCVSRTPRQSVYGARVPSLIMTSSESVPPVTYRAATTP